MNRADLLHRFEGRTSPFWKTFVLEAHADGDPAGLLRESATGDAEVVDTDDAFLHELRAEGLSFTVDHLDARFWSLHTEAKAGPARRVVKRMVEDSRNLDFMWLPSEHMRTIWPGTSPHSLRSRYRQRRLLPPNGDVDRLNFSVSGSDDVTERVLKALAGAAGAGAISFDQAAVRAQDDALGEVDEVVSTDGRFVVTGGSFEFHQELTRGVVSRYRCLVEAVERRALTFGPLEGGGGTVEGAPITILLSRPVQDLAPFVENLFSSREPFRLWGLPSLEGGRAEVQAVDLHIGQRIRLEVFPELIRVFLFEGGCGNTVARLVTNLQHHLDGALSFADPELDAALRAEPTGTA